MKSIMLTFMLVFVVMLFTSILECIGFLKSTIVNQFICASFLGCNADYEGVRIYTGKAELVARILLDKGLVTMAESYSTAIKAAVPDVKSLIPSHTLTLRTALHSQKFTYSKCILFRIDLKVASF